MANASVMFRRSLATFGAQVFCTLCSLLNNFIIARSLGPLGKGETYVVYLISGIMITFLLAGLDQAMVYFAGRNLYPKREILGTTSLLALTGSIIGIGVFLAVPWHWRQALTHNLSLTLQVIMLLSVPFIFLTLIGAFFALALNEVSTYNILRSAPVPIFSLLLISAYPFLPHNVVIVALLWLASMVVSFVLGLSLTNRLSGLRMSFNRRYAREAIPFGLKTHVGAILQFFSYRLDAFMVNYWWGGAEVGLYSIAVAAAEVLWFVPHSAATVMGPEIPRRDALSANQLTPWICRNVLWLTAAGAAAMYVLSYPLLKLLLPAFVSAVPSLRLLLPGIVAFCVTKILSSDLIGRGRPLVPTYVALASTLVAGLLYIKLIPPYGMWGAALASTIAYAFSALLSLVVFVQITGVRIPALLLPRLTDAQIFSKLYAEFRLNFSGRNRA